MTESKPIIRIVLLKDAWHERSEEGQMEFMREDRQRPGTR